jgi:hypothetical protein
MTRSAQKIARIPGGRDVGLAVLCSSPGCGADQALLWGLSRAIRGPGHLCDAHCPLAARRSSRASARVRGETVADVGLDGSLARGRHDRRRPVRGGAGSGPKGS